MEVIQFTFNPFQENTFLLHDGQVGVIVDPGCYERNEEDQLFNKVTELGIRIEAILLTHAHIDHVLGLRSVCKKYNLGFYIHSAEIETLQAVKNYAHVYGFPLYGESEADPIKIKHGDVLRFGNLQFEVKHTPGHSVGHVVYHMPAHSLLINGDVLFQGSFGRVDLPGGDLETLKKSIFEILFELPDETQVLCGHGPATQIGIEKIHNYIHQF